MLRYQCTGKKWEAAARAGQVDPNRDSTDAIGINLSMQRDAGVIQRLLEAQKYL